MLSINELKKLGVNTEEGLERCLDDEEFYLSLIETALDESGIEKLETELNNGEIQKAFESAHALKGVYGNMALTPIYDPIAEITEILRKNSTENISVLMKEFKENFTKLKALL